jgi:transcriptional regulator with XRE-family HTH domain
MTVSNSEIGAQIRRIREKKNLTLLELQALTGINNGSLSKIETGKQGLTTKAMESLSKALEVPIGDFFLTSVSDGVPPTQRPEKNVPNVKHLGNNSAPGAVFKSTGVSGISRYETTHEIPWDQNVAIGIIEARPDAARGGVMFSAASSREILFQGSLIRTIEANPNALASHEITDDMMTPLMHMGDSVVIDLDDRIVPVNGGVFAVVLDGETVCIRRLLPYINKGLRIICDNPKYPEITLAASQVQSITIAGRVKGRQGTGGF